MKLSLTSWSMPSCTLDEVAGISKVLGIGAIDVGLFYNAALDRNEILTDPKAAAQMVTALGLVVPNYYHLFGDGLAGRNLALADALDENCRDLEQVLAFCEAAQIATVFVLPGIVNPGQSREQALAQSARSLNALIAVASHSSVTLTIE
ncbi:MAG: sugar phosphate isomerase/epimerase, partial [Pseudomonadota bacterium]